MQYSVHKFKGKKNKVNALLHESTVLQLKSRDWLQTDQVFDGKDV